MKSLRNKAYLHIIDNIFMFCIISVQNIQIVCIPAVKMSVIITSNNVFIQETPKCFNWNGAIVFVLWQFSFSDCSLTGWTSNIKNIDSWSLLHFSTRWKNFKYSLSLVKPKIFANSPIRLPQNEKLTDFAVAVNPALSSINDV